MRGRYALRWQIKTQIAFFKFAGAGVTGRKSKRFGLTVQRGGRRLEA
jgi:hypothetical protein